MVLSIKAISAYHLKDSMYGGTACRLESYWKILNPCIVSLDHLSQKHHSYVSSYWCRNCKNVFESYYQVIGVWVIKVSPLFNILQLQNMRIDCISIGNFSHIYCVKFNLPKIIGIWFNHGFLLWWITTINHSETFLCYHFERIWIHLM